MGVVNFGFLLPFRELALYKNQRVIVKTIGSKLNDQLNDQVKDNQKLLKDQLIMLHLSPSYLNTGAIFLSRLKGTAVCCILDENNIAI